MEPLTFINILNLLSCILISISAIYGFMELEINFVFTNLIALIYTCVSALILVITSIAGLRGLHPPEILDSFENHYMEFALIVFTSLLFIGTSFTGMIMGIILVCYSLIISAYIKFYHKYDSDDNSTPTTTSV